jgi:hypothetical protein
VKRFLVWLLAKRDFGWRAKVYRERFGGKDYCVINLNGVRYGLGNDWNEALEDARLNWPENTA